MSDPLVLPADLGVYLNDPGINTARASAIIADAQALCETIITPLPPVAAVIVRRIAARAYTSITSARAAQLGNQTPPFGTAPSGLGGVWLSRADKADLRRFNGGGGGAFTIETMLPTAGDGLPWWDRNVGPFYGDDFDSIPAP